MKAEETRSVELFRNNYNCAQSVFASRAALVGLSEIDAKRIALGFGSGIARTQQICGACAGAVMLIGAGLHDEADPPASKARVYEIVKTFLEEFRAMHGSTDCRILLGADLGTEEGVAEAKAKRLFETKCERFVIDAGRLAEKFLR